MFVQFVNIFLFHKVVLYNHRNKQQAPTKEGNKMKKFYEVQTLIMLDEGKWVTLKRFEKSEDAERSLNEYKSKYNEFFRILETYI